MTSHSLDTPPAMTGDEMVALTKAHTLFEWSAQSKVDPIPVARREGHAGSGRPRASAIIDFNSQLMCVNIGHGDERVIKAIQEQAATLAYANPFMATEPRARLGAKLAALAPGDIDVFFFTNGGAEANENAIKLARMYTGPPQDPGALPLVSRRHRRRDRADRRSAALGGRARHPGRRPRARSVSRHPARLGRRRGSSLAKLEEVIQLEGPQTIAAFFLETVTGTNGILVPPDGYLQGVRALCTKHGILMICRRGDGRLRPHRRMVRGQSLERRARHADDGEGADERVRAARRRRHAARRSPITSRTRCSTAG